MKKNSIPKNLLQTGMTLADRRYRIDQWVSDNGLTVTYKGYDTFRKKDIIIIELFSGQIMQRDPDHDYKVECKKMSDEDLFDSMKEHMIRRAKKLIRMYPVEGIVNVLTYLEERNTVYVIEEYVEGQTLDQLLLKRHSAKFLPEDLMQYLAPVMDTLSKLHGNDLFHGAVYPDNILITKDKKVVLAGCTNPMEDVASPQLSGIAARNDAYAPVELFVPEAGRGPSADIFEVSAILYRYVTGQPLPVYYDRVNEETVTAVPEDMMTRVMKFQSEAIMKGVAVYDFNRFATIGQLKSAICPDDVDYESLNSDLGVARNFTKEPFWYRYQKNVKRKYLLLVGGILLIAALFMGPELVGVGRSVMTEHFYKKLIEKDTAGRFEMLMELSDSELDMYTNNYRNQDKSLTDEQRSAKAVTKYYDFQLEKYVTQEKFNTDRNYYEYMKIDCWDKEIWVTYISDWERVQTIYSVVPEDNGQYRITTIEADGNGVVKEDICYIVYKN